MNSYSVSGKQTTPAKKGKEKKCFTLVLKFCVLQTFPTCSSVFSQALYISHSYRPLLVLLGISSTRAKNPSNLNKSFDWGPRGTGMHNPRKCDRVPLLLSRERDGGLYLPVPEHCAGEAGGSKCAAWVPASPATCECSRGTRKLGQHLWGH